MNQKISVSINFKLRILNLVLVKLKQRTIVMFMILVDLSSVGNENMVIFKETL